MNIIQKYIIPLIIAAVFGSGAWKIKGLKTSKELHRMDKIVKSYADSMKTEKATIKTLTIAINSCKTDSSVMKGQIEGLQKNALILSNSNRAKAARIKEAEDNLKKAIESGQIKVNEQQTFLEKIFKRKK